MQRRDFLAAAGLSLATAATPAAAAVRQGDKPNVLFIAIDDLNDWIGALGGHPQAKTPNLDRLASRGVLFEKAYCAVPACNPSRTALMTGIPAHQSGVYLNAQPWRPVLPNAVTIPQHFRAHGYWAGGSGKIYHGRFPDPPSWDEYFPSKEQQKPDDPRPAKRPANGIPKTTNFDWGPVTEGDDAMGDSQVANWISQQLARDFDKPFFLAFGLYRPHLPWYVPKKYFDAFPLDEIELPSIRDDDLDDVPAAGRKMARPQRDHASVTKHDQYRQAVQAYLASGYFADTQLGKVLDALQSSAYADNTVVVLWTDHGWHLGEKHHWRKFALWEEALRTPMMWVVPKGTPGLESGTTAGGRCPRPVSHTDIYPTLIELCGLSEKPELPGTSLTPLLAEPTAAWNRPAVSTYGRKNHSVRTERWRFIQYADGSEELYDHQNDPMEWTNLANRPEHRDLIARLRRWLPVHNAPDAPKAS